MNLRYFEDPVTKRLGYDFYADIAENIVAQRKQHDWTQEDLARESKVKIGRIRRIEEVTTRIWLRELEAIAKALSVSELFLTGEDPVSKAGECLFTVAPSSCTKFSLYAKAQTYGLAFLKIHQLNACVRMFQPRDRAIVTLKGVPVTDEELQAKFPKRGKNFDDDLEKD